jgi:hypothetical protein
MDSLRLNVGCMRCLAHTQASPQAAAVPQQHAAPLPHLLLQRLGTAAATLAVTAAALTAAPPPARADLVQVRSESTGACMRLFVDPALLLTTTTPPVAAPAPHTPDRARIAGHSNGQGAAQAGNRQGQGGCQGEKLGPEDSQPSVWRNPPTCASKHRPRGLTHGPLPRTRSPAPPACLC